MVEQIQGKSVLVRRQATISRKNSLSISLHRVNTSLKLYWTDEHLG